VSKYLVIGEDDRQRELAALFEIEAKSEDSAEIKEAAIIIIPIGKPSETLEKLLISNVKKEAIIFGGNISDELRQGIVQSDAKFYSITDFPAFQEDNAIPTAEGTILIALQQGKVLHNSRCLVLGYGNCGSRLVSLLLGFGSYMDIYDKNFTNNFSVLEGQVRSISFDDLTENLEEYNFIFNTIPEQIFDEEDIEKIQGSIINIASDDAGFPKDRRFPNIPSLLFPKESAKIMKKVIDKCLKSIFTQI